MRSSGGTSCQIGSPKSKVLVRIYDKAAERGLADGRHWVRVELQLRDKRAEEFLKIPMCIGKAFAGVLLNYLLFQMKPQSPILHPAISRQYRHQLNMVYLFPYSGAPSLHATGYIRWTYWRRGSAEVL